MKLTIATLNTGNFTFTAIGQDEDHAYALMAQAWSTHAAQTSAWDQWSDVRESVNYTETELGGVVRDGSPMALTARPCTCDEDAESHGPYCPRFR